MIPQYPIPRTPLDDPGVKQSLEEAYQRNQTMANAAKIQQLSTAEHIAQALYHQIITFQANLPSKDDVVMMLVQFGQSTTLCVTDIGYIGYNLVCFFGKDSKGNDLELIQHINQLSFLLQVVPKSQPDAPKRKIGFVGQVEGD